MSNDKKWSINYSWSQPYVNWQPYTFPQLDPYNEDMMDREEKRIEAMDTYPDAERLIKNIFKY